MQRFATFLGLLMARTGCAVSPLLGVLQVVSYASARLGLSLPDGLRLQLAILLDRLSLPAHTLMILTAFLLAFASTRPSPLWQSLYGLGWAIVLPVGLGAFSTFYTFWALFFHVVS